MRCDVSEQRARYAWAELPPRRACAWGTQGFVALTNGLPLVGVRSPSLRVAHQSGTSSVVAGSVRE